MTSAITLSMEDRKALVLQRAIAQYEALREKWLSERTPDQLALIEENLRKPRPLHHALSIEKERSGVVTRSLYPYPGLKVLKW
ncbi:MULTISPECIES: hypothetical protein [Aeromonas]|uniref:Uncharacterized protein n=1 Tax=Aeromonas veronii TaxID=654 RepID=A0AAX2UPW7_AERVE|nr:MULTISPECIES: hypothetical protein [Aeromonas]MCD6618713.1 hypothetical protein [Aeromonas veronii]QWZ66461.1 hypothetical protein I6L47_22035 [Aeromonas sp. FDAARGOS 1417]TND51845.1 hypothetical protein CF123_18420 [Aeromonas veronii]BEE07041.1 hypothetical protein VAWG002_42370 [Aeromonas veronii]